MKLDLETLQQRCPKYATIPSLSCDSLHLSSISSLPHCLHLHTLSLRFNALISIASLQYCRRLWRIDLRNNRIMDVSPLANFQALGMVLLTSNPISLSGLRRLRQVHILELEVEVPDMTHMERREQFPREL